MQISEHREIKQYDKHKTSSDNKCGEDADGEVSGGVEGFYGAGTWGDRDQGGGEACRGGAERCRRSHHGLRRAGGNRPGSGATGGVESRSAAGSFGLDGQYGLRSGLRAVALASQAVQLGDAEFVVAGGMESMSNIPYAMPGARDGYRMGNQTVVDLMIHDGLWCPFENWHMGNTGEVVAEKYQITREEQDEFAFDSHRKAPRRRQQADLRTRSFRSRSRRRRATRSCSTTTNRFGRIRRSKLSVN